MNMDEETILGISFTIIFSVFLLCWKWMPWNMPPIYAGMIAPPEMIMTYTITIGGIIIALFMWAWIGLRG